MFIELDTFDKDSNIDCDICIVGAGAAGITMALELANSDYQVILLESGGMEYQHDTQMLNKGKITGIPYVPLESARLRFFGGTTNHWAGQSTPLEPIDFENRDWVPDGGWPIGYQDYAQYLQRAQKVCKLGPAAFDHQVWSDKFDSPFEDNNFQPVIFRYPSPVIRFGEAYRDPIAKSNNIKCILNANATNLIQSVDDSIQHVQVNSLTGNAIRVTAKYVVLATGCIQNVKLMMNSNQKYAEGLGNKYDQLGRYFMEHPNYDTGEVFFSDSANISTLVKPRTQLDGTEVRIDFQLTPEEQKKHQVLNHSVFFINKPRPAEKFDDGLVGSISKYWKKVENKLNINTQPETYRIRVRLEHAPVKDNRIELDEEQDALGMFNVKLNMKMGELESKTISTLQMEIAKLLGANNVGRMKTEFNGGTKWQENVGWQYHHFGGTKMHNSPEKGVVDSDCKVHGIDNLFIASSSVFPTCGHANPTLNIVALTLRLSDHLKRASS
ncbi:MAG: choline dehydrogenase-like flavoprotein [Paraglaciecola sp.]|jgi:choline dehydrogenase-like flavoprotein